MDVLYLSDRFSQRRFCGASGLTKVSPRLAEMGRVCPVNSVSRQRKKAPLADTQDLGFFILR